MEKYRRNCIVQLVGYDVKSACNAPLTINEVITVIYILKYPINFSLSDKFSIFLPPSSYAQSIANIEDDNFV